MLDILAVQEQIAKVVNSISSYETYIANYDYEGLELVYPRVVVGLDAIDYLASHSRETERTDSTETTKRKKVHRQFLLPVRILTIGRTGESDVRQMANKIKAKIEEDYDLIFEGYEDLEGLAYGGSDPIESMGFVISTLVEDHATLRIFLSGTEVVYDEEIPKVADASFGLINV